VRSPPPLNNACCELRYIIWYLIQDRSIAGTHNSIQPVQMMSLCMPLQHFKNSDEAVNQEVFICHSNCVMQRFDFFIKPCDHLANGAILWGIQQASNTNFIHCFLHIPTKLAKPLAVTNVVVSEFFVCSRHFSFTVYHELSIFPLECVNSSVQPHACLLHFLLTHRQ
jgi:hypothetical protein